MTVQLADWLNGQGSVIPGTVMYVSDQAWAGRNRMLTAVRSVLDLHAKTVGDDPQVAWCGHCTDGWDAEDWDRVAWPCATVRAVAAATGTTP